jgi:hypothetical protein
MLQVIKQEAAKLPFNRLAALSPCNAPTLHAAAPKEPNLSLSRPCIAALVM